MRTILFFLTGLGFLVLSSCSGGSGGGVEVGLTFTPTTTGFIIGSQSDLSEFEFLNITATSESGSSSWKVVPVAALGGSGYSFTNLTDQSSYTFRIKAILSDGSERDVGIDFVLEENEEDHKTGGIRPGLNTDGDGRADSVDDDDDGDGVADVDEVNGCELKSDCDGDGTADVDEAAGCVLNPACNKEGVENPIIGGGDNSSGEETSKPRIALTFVPVPGGFIIGNHSDLSAFNSLHITITQIGSDKIGFANVSASGFSQDNSIILTEFPDQFSYTFMIKGIFSNGSERDLEIDFVWEENEEDHNERGGIQPGANSDGDGRADSVDTDDDNDGVADDGGDRCPIGETGWESDSLTDYDGDGCRDAGEDADDDNDGVADDDEESGCAKTVDCDNDRVTDANEERGCAKTADCDNDGVRDTMDMCMQGTVGWRSNGTNDTDGDGCRDRDEDTKLVGVTGLVAIPAVGEVNLSWINPNVSLSGFNISWVEPSGAANFTFRMDNLTALGSASIKIENLDDETNFTFVVEAHYANGGISRPAAHIRVQTGANHDEDRLADSLDPDDDNDGVRDGMDICIQGVVGWRSNIRTNDRDGDGCRDRDEDTELVRVTSLVAIPAAGEVNLSWINPNISLSGFNISWDEPDGTTNFTFKRDELAALGSASIEIEDLDDETNFTFVVEAHYESENRPTAHIRVQTGANYDGDRLADSLDSDDDNDGVRDVMDRCMQGIVGWRSDGMNDTDGDGCRDRDEDTELVGVMGLVAVPTGDRVELRWINPNVSLSGFNISWDEPSGAANFIFKTTELVALGSASIEIENLAEETNFTFVVEAHYANGGISRPAANITVQTGISPPRIALTFAPIATGFIVGVGSHSGLSAFSYFRITMIAPALRLSVTTPQPLFLSVFDPGTRFTLHTHPWFYGHDHIFRIRGFFSDGSERDLEIDFVWEENEVDHNERGGIREGANRDGDGRADSVDTDDDNDGVADDDGGDRCPIGEIGWESNISTDHDGDGCRDAGEDTDDDNDGVADDDGGDRCPIGETGWESNILTDRDGDGCRDAGEDTDDDNDGVLDSMDTGMAGDRECRLYADCDNDGVLDSMDTGMVGGRECRLYADCDNDGVTDGVDLCPTGEMDWESNSLTDHDGDGCRDTDEDTDDDNDGIMNDGDVDMDGDGLIEIGTAAELNAVRYALDGSGRKLSMDGILNTSGCGDQRTITSCNGYELVADIDLADYIEDTYGAQGWQPLGHDTTDELFNPSFHGTLFTAAIFEGNDWTISNLRINRPSQSYVGLFGFVAVGSEIRNLNIHAEKIEAKDFVGGLVGSGRRARIVSSSVVVGQVRGRYDVGALVGSGDSTEIFSSSIVVGEVSGDSAFGRVGSLVGNGFGARIYSSSVVAGSLKGSDVGGLVGYGDLAKIFSSSVVAGELRGSRSVGGLVGEGHTVQIVSSSVVAGSVSGGSMGIMGIGGLVGEEDPLKPDNIAYSYVVLGNGITNMLAGSSNIIASYWDSDTSGIGTGTSAKTSNQLRSPTALIGYDEGIYADWDDETDIFGDGMDEPLAVWCDRNNSGLIEGDERTDDNRIWDFGDSSEYPAIGCLPISPAEWRGWWSLNAAGKPQLNHAQLSAIVGVPFEVEFTFAPIEGGFNISSQSDFSTLVSLNITATSESHSVSAFVPVTTFRDGSYDLTGLSDQSNYTFAIRGILSDGRKLDVAIVFDWEENEEDHNERGGIRPGLNTDGDGRADSVDTDDDNDGVLDGMDTGEVGGRECRLYDDCDMDRVPDGIDLCPVSAQIWQSDLLTDNDGDGCRDADEDKDDDNDGVLDVDDTGMVDGRECRLSDDCDGDGVLDGMDTGMVGGRECRLSDDCDRDGVLDGMDTGMVDGRECRLYDDCDMDSMPDGIDSCPVSAQSWQSNLLTDRDSDGCRDTDEDIDGDGDGLIEIATAAELDAVRYALDGSGRKLSMNGMLNTSGCGDGTSITECSGYELIADIDLLDYADDDDGKGWQPLRHDTDSGTNDCQGEAFNGTFAGNGFVISNLSINRAGENCVGLFGALASDSEIRNLTLYAEEVTGYNQVGSLAGYVEGALIISSSVVVKRVSGWNGIGGLVGSADGFRIISSSVVASEVGGLFASFNNVGGLAGQATDSDIISSSVVAGEVSGGFGFYSQVGGLTGTGSSNRIISSLVVAGEVSGGSNTGGMVGSSGSSTITNSYAVLGAGSVRMLAASGTNMSSYWDGDTSGITGSGVGTARTTSQLRMPTGYTGPYSTWDDGADTTIYCDRDGSGAIEPGERDSGNQIWDFGTSEEYPAIRCTPVGPTEWRSWWFLNSDNDPELNRTRLDALFAP